MKITLTPKQETSQVELDITVPAADFSTYLKKAVKELSTNKPLPGFRPGAAPLPVALKEYGEHAVLHRAMDMALPHYFVRAVIDQKVDAIGRPAISIQQLSLGQDFRFSATVAVMPQVKLGDITTLKTTRRLIETNDEELDRELKQLAVMRSTYLEVMKPAEMGDTTVLDFKVSMNGQVIKGGESKNHPINLGEGHFVPGFEEKVKGIRAGDAREFEITFPGDYGHQEYRGQKALVWVKAHSVHKKIVPELNDEFAKKLGKFENLEQLRKNLRENITTDKLQKEKERMRGELSKQLATAATFSAIPDILIDREIDHRLTELTQFLAYQGKTIDDYIKEKNKTVAGIRADLREPALESIKIALALRAFADQEKIKVERHEVEERMHQPAHADIDPTQLRDEIAAHLRTQKALERLEQVAKIIPPPAA